MTSDQTDDQLIEEHDRAVRIIAEAVYGLTTRFPTIPPISIFEGTMKGAITIMLTRQGDSLGDIADLLEDVAAALRRDEGSEWRVSMN